MDGAGGAAAFPGAMLGVGRSVCGRRWRMRGGGGARGHLGEKRASPVGGGGGGGVGGDRGRSSRPQPAFPARHRKRNPEPPRRNQPAWLIGGGRRGVSARRRGQPRATPGGLV